ncbi:phage tail protein I, partial [Cereibacter changlensis]
MTSILPPNATKAERAFEAALAALCDLPVPVGQLWSPETCPAALLPWLAWALSVDDWDPA